MKLVQDTHQPTLSKIHERKDNRSIAQSMFMEGLWKAQLFV